MLAGQRSKGVYLELEVTEFLSIDTEQSFGFGSKHGDPLCTGCIGNFSLKSNHRGFSRVSGKSLVAGSVNTHRNHVGPFEIVVRLVAFLASVRAIIFIDNLLATSIFRTHLASDDEDHGYVRSSACSTHHVDSAVLLDDRAHRFDADIVRFVTQAKAFCNDLRERLDRCCNDHDASNKNSTENKRTDLVGYWYRLPWTDRVDPSFYLRYRTKHEAPLCVAFPSDPDESRCYSCTTDFGL